MRKGLHGAITAKIGMRQDLSQTTKERNMSRGEVQAPKLMGV